MARHLERWASLSGIIFVVAIALPFDVIYISIGPFLLWVLVASIVLLMRREAAIATATAAASPRERVA